MSVSTSFSDRHKPKQGIVNVLREEFLRMVDTKYKAQFSEVAHHLIEGSLVYRELEKNYDAVLAMLKQPGGSVDSIERDFQVLHTAVRVQMEKHKSHRVIEEIHQFYNDGLDQLLGKHGRLQSTLSQDQRDKLIERFEFIHAAHLFRTVQISRHTRMDMDPKKTETAENVLREQMQKMWPDNPLGIDVRIQDYRNELAQMNIPAEKETFYGAKATEWIANNQSQVAELMKRHLHGKEWLGTRDEMKQFIHETVKEALFGTEQKRESLFSVMLRNRPRMATPLTQTYETIDNALGMAKRATFEAELRSLAAPRETVFGSPG